MDAAEMEKTGLSDKTVAWRIVEKPIKKLIWG